MKKNWLIVVTFLAVFPLCGIFAHSAEAAKQELVIAIGAQPESLDPIAMASAPAATVGDHIHQTLIFMAPDGTLKPSLAESWEAAKDGLSWTLKLRKGVKFHDGTPFNAQAVKVNLDRFRDPDNKAPYRFLIVEITGVEVVDDYTVRLTLKRPFAPITAHLSHSFIGMLSPKSLEGLEKGKATDKIVGTGPFKIVNWTRGEQIVLEANPDYWGGAPKIKKLTFKFIPEDAARVVMLETGEAHAIMRVPPADAKRLDANPKINVVKASSVRVIYIGFNTQVEPFNNPKVRQAMNYAVNKKAIIDTILAGVGEASTAPVVPAVFGYTKVGPYEYDPKKARQLLAEAGYPKGFKAVFHHPTGRYLMDSTIAEAVQAMVREIGVELELQTMEWATYLGFVRKPPAEAKHQMYMLGWGCVTLDADYGLYALLHSSQWPMAGWGVSFYKNEKVDDLLQTARITPDRKDRTRMYTEAIKLIWNDAPWLYLHNEGQVNAVRSNVKGLIHHPLENIHAWDAYIE
jgi:ABC-type transport system substrate-binding protein